MASSFDRTGGGRYSAQNTSFARTSIGLTPDLSSSEGLYLLAQEQGGAVAQAANEIYHPTTGILSSIGSSLKSAFRGFVNTLSVPSEVIAGIMSTEYTIGEAISKNIKPSDVLYGEKDPDGSIYKKTGSFILRTATDILLDPLTYITFGAGSGILGIRRGAQITLQENAAKLVGKNAMATGVLNQAGDDLLKQLTKVSRQMKGGTAAEILKTGNQALDFGVDELEKIMKITLDSPLQPDFAKKALSNLLEKNPAYVTDFLDAGGIKVFGKSILSGQRVRSTFKLIPGMTTLDQITYQPRMMLGSLFNPAIIKGDEGYIRLPQEYVDMHQKWGDFARTYGEDRIKNLDDIVKQFKLTDTEARFLTASLEYRRVPTDKRLADAFKATLGFNESEWTELTKSGLISNYARLEGHVPHVLVKNKVTTVAWKMPPSVSTGATEMRKMARFVDEKTGATISGHADELGLKASKDAANIFTDGAGNTFKREVEPLHKIAGEEEFSVLEGTLLKNEKNAQKMLDDMRQDGFQGFDDNAITALAARSLKNTKAIGMRYFLKELAENFGHDAAVAGALGYKRINSTGLKEASEEAIQVLGKEGELMFHPAIANHVEKFMGSLLNDDATMDFLKAYDSLQNAWKATVTSIWPAFHGRNALSNVFQNYLDIGLNAMNPKVHAMSTSLIKTDRQLNKLARAAMGTGDDALKAQTKMNALLQREMFTDATGYKWTYGELRQVAKNNNIAFTSRIVTSNDVQGGADSLVKALFPAKGVVEKGKKAVAAPFKFGQDVVGRTLEEQARLVNFLSNLRATGDVIHAAKRTKQFLFDYNNLTNFERMFLRRLIPFYTFTRKNLELQIRTLATTPGRIAAEVHAITTLGEVISGGEQLTDEEYAALPDWVKSGIGILTKKRGDNVSLITNLGTPLEQPFQMIQANVFLGSFSPLVRLPLEQMSGYSFFQGKPLSEATNAAAFVHAPKVIQDFIGFTEVRGKKSDGTPYTWYVSLHPERMNLMLNLPPTTRVFTALKQMDAVDVSSQAKILQQLTGLRPYSFDLERERQKREKEMMSQLENILTKAGVTAQFKRTFIPKGEYGI